MAQRDAWQKTNELPMCSGHIPEVENGNAVVRLPQESQWCIVHQDSA